MQTTTIETRNAAGAGFPPRRYVGLLLRWTRRDFDSRYMRSALSAMWAIVQPFAFLGVYVLVFGVIFKQNGGDLPYLSVLLAGMVVFRLVSSALSANTCFSDSLSIVSHAAFPREIVPLSRTLGAAIDLAVTVPALLAIAAVQGIRPHWSLLLLPLVLLSLLLYSAAVCIIVSTIQAFVRDLQFVMNLLTQALFFASPISYQANQVPHWMRFLNVVNPISVDIEALRDVALRGVAPQWGLLGFHFVLACLLLFGSIAHLRSVQHRIVDLA